MRYVPNEYGLNIYEDDEDDVYEEDVYEEAVYQQTVYIINKKKSEHRDDSKYYRFINLDVPSFYTIKMPLRTINSYSMVDYSNPKLQKVLDCRENTIQVRAIHFIEVLFYLHSIGVRFDAYVGIKNAYAQLEQFPIDKSTSKSVRDFFTAIGVKIHKSGEIPIPSNLADFQWMPYIDFNNDFTGFTLKPKNLCSINNSRKEALYAEAENQYWMTQYKGSKQEVADMQVKENQARMVNLSMELILKADLEFIESLLDEQLPSDSYLKTSILLKDVWDIKTKEPIRVTDIILFIGSYDSLVRLASTELFQQFAIGRANHGTPLRVEKGYRIECTESIYLRGDPEYYGRDKNALDQCFKTIDEKQNLKKNLDAMKVLMFDLVSTFEESIDWLALIAIEQYFIHNGLEEFILEKYDDYILGDTADEWADNYADICFDP